MRYIFLVLESTKWGVKIRLHKKNTCLFFQRIDNVSSQLKVASLPPVLLAELCTCPKKPLFSPTPVALQFLFYHLSRQLSSNSFDWVNSLVKGCHFLPSPPCWKLIIPFASQRLCRKLPPRLFNTFAAALSWGLHWPCGSMVRGRPSVGVKSKGLPAQKALISLQCVPCWSLGSSIFHSAPQCCRIRGS